MAWLKKSNQVHGGGYITFVGRNMIGGLSTNTSEDRHLQTNGIGARINYDSNREFEWQYAYKISEGDATYYLNKVDLVAGTLAAPATCTKGDTHNVGEVYLKGHSSLGKDKTIGTVATGGSTNISYASLPKSEAGIVSVNNYHYTYIDFGSEKKTGNVFNNDGHNALITATGLKFDLYYGCKISASSEDTDKGTVSVSNSSIVEPGTSVTITASAKTGWQFSRWSDGNTNSSRSVAVDGKTSYTAYFEEIPYKINLNLAYKGKEDNIDGTEKLSSTSGWTLSSKGVYERQYKITSSTITLPTVTKNYYTFMGWSTSSTSNPDSFSATTEVAKGSTGNKNYYAIYKPTGYTIEYKLNGGTNNPSNKGGYTVESDTFVIGEPTKKGYNFAGWMENGQLLGRTITIPKGSSGNRSFEAKFTVIHYDLDFDYQESIYGSIKPTNDSSYTVDNAVVLNPPDATNRGWRFIGWTELVTNKETGQTISTNSINTTSTYTIPAGNIENRKYTARYEAIQYPITYKWSDSLNSVNAEYGVNISGLHTYYTVDKDCNLAEKTPTRPGYSFSHYSVTEGGASTPKIEKGTSTGPRTFYLNFNGTTKTLESFAFVGTVEITSEIDYFIDVGFSKNKIKQGKNVNNIAYVDNISYDLSVAYNPNLFKFEGWKHSLTDTNYITKSDGTQLKEIDSITVSPYDGNQNKYYAIFSYIPYTLNILMRDSSISNMPLGIYGKVLAEGLRDGVNMEVQNGDQPKVQITNLHYDDVFTLSIIPYYNDIAGVRYHCTHWTDPTTGRPSGNPIMQCKIDQTWSTSENRHAYFTQTTFDNTVSDKNTDKTALTALLTKTISNFVVNYEIDTLGDYSFINCKNLEYVYAPGVKIMGDRTCQGCDKLQTVVISTTQDSGASIGIESFKDCPKLNLLIIPEGFMELNQLFSIGDDASDRNEWSLFKRGLGEIYVNENLYNEYVKTSTTNWPVYKNVIKKIDSDQKVYPYSGGK